MTDALVRVLIQVARIANPNLAGIMIPAPEHATSDAARIHFLKEALVIDAKCVEALMSLADAIGSGNVTLPSHGNQIVDCGHLLYAAITIDRGSADAFYAMGLYLERLYGAIQTEPKVFYIFDDFPPLDGARGAFLCAIERDPHHWMAYEGLMRTMRQGDTIRIPKSRKALTIGDIQQLLSHEYSLAYAHAQMDTDFSEADRSSRSSHRLFETVHPVAPTASQPEEKKVMVVTTTTTHSLSPIY